MGVSEDKERVRDGAETAWEREDEVGFGVARASCIVTTLTESVVTSASMMVEAEDGVVLSSFFSTAEEAVDGFGVAKASCIVITLTEGVVTVVSITAATEDGVALSPVPPATREAVDALELTQQQRKKDVSNAFS